MKDRRIGAHVSSAGGFPKAVERAAAIGANCMQVFSSSPRGWANNWERSLDSEKLFSKQKELNVTPIFTHGLYLINLASENQNQLDKSIQALKAELHFDSAVKGSGVIVHLGSHMGSGWVAVKDQLAQSISRILSSTPEDSTFLIENSAGQNGKVSSNLAEIRWLLDTVDSPRLKWCFDTCHGFAAGYLLGNPAGVETDRHVLFSEEPKYAATAIEQLDLWKDLRCIHVNDSKQPYNSGKDRHENLLEGEVPQEDFSYFLNLPQVREIPLIMEVPGFKGEGPDAENISRLKSLLQ